MEHKDTLQNAEHSKSRTKKKKKKVEKWKVRWMTSEAVSPDNQASTTRLREEHFIIMSLWRYSQRLVASKEHNYIEVRVFIVDDGGFFLACQDFGRTFAQLFLQLQV